jgi:serine protease
MQNARAFPVGARDELRGAGMLDAAATVAAARSGKIPVAANFTCSQSDQLMQVTCADFSTARGAAIKSWAWNFGDNRPDMVSTQSVNPTVWFDQPGTYEFALTVTDSNGAISRLTRRFNVVPPTVTDITNNVYPLRFGTQPNERIYFSVDNRWLMKMGPNRYTEYTLMPGSSGEIAQLDVTYGSLSMASPNCSAVMSGAGAATCRVGVIPGLDYIMVTSTTRLNGASIQFKYGMSPGWWQ